MKLMNKAMLVLLCVALLCVGLVGCESAGTTTVGTQVGTNSTAPTHGGEGTTTTTQPDDGFRTLLLTTQGNLPLVGKNITIYADAELTQRVTVLRSDEQGMATFQGEPDSTYYAVVESIFGYTIASSYTMEEPVTQIQLACDLVDLNHRRNLELGDIMYDLDYTDWNGNPYRLADAMEAGKDSIIVQLGLASARGDEVLAWLQTVYETYGDRLDVVLLCKPDGVSDLQGKVEAMGITYPVVTVQKNNDWMLSSHVTVVDRYGMLVMTDSMAPVDQPTIDGIVRYFTADTYQQRLFEDGVQLLDYLDSLQPTEEVSYKVKLVDDTGAPLAGIYLRLYYPRRTMMAVTDEQGVATFTINRRDDLQVGFSDAFGILETYICEDDGLFAPGATEKTIVLRRRQMTQYTVRAVDTDGNPVENVKIWKHNSTKFLTTDTTGMVQWQDLEREVPYYHDSKAFTPQGYLYSHTEQNGTEYIIVFMKLYRYSLQIVNEEGEAMDFLSVSYQVGDQFCWVRTDADGWVTFWAVKGDVTVEAMDIFGTQVSKTFVIPFGQEETVYTWVDETVEYRIWLVWSDGTPAQYLTVDLIRADGSSIVSDGSGSEGYVSFQLLPGTWNIYVYGGIWQDGQAVMVEYGVFDFPEGKTEVTIVLERDE